jgi:hypothetical protein
MVRYKKEMLEFQKFKLPRDLIYLKADSIFVDNPYIFPSQIVECT